MPNYSIGISIAIAASLIAGAYFLVSPECCTAQKTSDSATITAVPPATFQSAIRQKETIILDVRTPEEYRAGHIEGARNLNIASPDFLTTLATMDKNATYAVYCRTDNRSGQAVARMQESGFKHVIHLDGGIVAWQAAGLALVTD